MVLDVTRLFQLQLLLKESCVWFLLWSCSLLPQEQPHTAFLWFTENQTQYLLELLPRFEGFTHKLPVS